MMVASSLLKNADKQISEMRENGQEQLYFDIELPLIGVLVSMEIAGFRADKNMLLEFSEMLETEINILEKDIHEMAREPFNINSPKQLAVILFEKLGLPPVKKTKTGYSTSVDVLEKLKPRHAIIGKILQYRHLAKLKSTYADGLCAVINPETGRIHSNFNQTVTTTGRISSTEPNLQNIPVRTEIGRELRKVFVAENDDYVLVDADYSQIELRVLASISGDEKMCESFRENIDIHTKTASEIFNMPPDMITPEMRRKAKAVNFGIVYGIGDFSLSEDIGVSIREAKEYIEKYLKSYVGVKQYMKDTVDFAKENGFVKTLSGRRRYIPEISSSNYNLRSFGERVALNAPIQGTAADIIKLAMIRVYNALKREAPRSRLILQVHDELIVETHKDEEEKVKEIMKREMENAFTLAVPLVVDMASGRSWYDAK
jgi:DNA polymerase-1